MLRIPEVESLYYEVFSVRFRRKPHPDGDKGGWDAGEQEVSIYLPAIESQEDLDLTILHEFVHARNCLLTPRRSDLEDDVEREAIETYRKAPEVLDVIKQLYDIKR